jgi:hypothetical protein
MRKSTFVGMMTLATSLIVVAATTGLLNILSAYADPDGKAKAWIGSQFETGESCIKDDGGCKGQQVNKDARERCEAVNSEKCKQVQLD